MRTTLICLSFLLITHLGYAQTGSIKGRVIDAKTLKPLPFATVYLNQTTIGAITNDDGDFELTRIPGGRFDLIISYIGYKTYQARTVVNEGTVSHVAVKLVPSTTTLKEVVVRSKKDKGWERLYEKFAKYFFGVSPYTAQSRIKNPAVLDLTEDSNGIITATSTTPLEIENLGLGYLITCQLKECVVGPSLYKINGTYRFEEAQTMDTTLSKLWHTRREDVFLGSARHLLKTIVQKQSEALGYQLFKDQSNMTEVVRNSSFIANLNASRLAEMKSYDLVDSSSSQGLFILNMPSRTEVHYLKDAAPAKIYRNVPFPVSWIEVSGGSLEVSPSGVVMNPHQLTVAGAMGDAHIAELLPLDFDVVETPAVVATAARKQHSKLAALIEKPYVMTDKPYYYPADAILFKAFFNYMSPVYRDSLSHVVNVELLDHTGKVIKKKLFPVFNGTAVGDFALSTTTPPGDYTLRAYTRWMMNFGEKTVFNKPIKVLPHDRLGTIKEFEPLVKQVNVVTDKDEFETREKITLSLEATNFYGEVIGADLSVSVVDIEQAATPYNEANILTGYPFTTDMLPDTTLKKANYLIQYGIDFKGQMVVGKKKTPSAGSLTVYQDNVDDVFAITTDEKGNFHQQLQLMDSVDLFIHARTVKNKMAKIIIEEVYNPVPAIRPTDTLLIDTYRPADASKHHVVDLFSTAKMLEAVTIEAKKITETTPAGSKHLMSDTHLDGDRLRATNATDLLSALRSLVPGLRVMYVSVPGGDPIKLVIFSTGLTSAGRFEEAMVEVDGVAIGSDFDGMTAAERLSTMSVYEIESVDVVRFGMAAAFGARAANGVIVVKTSMGTKTKGPRKLDKERFQVVSLAGYSKAEDFVAPDYSTVSSGDDRLDLRSTIYWNPYIITQAKEPTKVSFYAADVPTRYRIVVEGVTADGEAVRGEKIIVVKSKN